MTATADGVPMVRLAIADLKYWLQHGDELREALAQAAGVPVSQIHQGPAGVAAVAQGIINVPLRLLSLFVPAVVIHPKSSGERLTLTVEESAQLLGISRSLAYDAIRRGEIPHIKIGNRILIPRSALERLLDLSSPAEPDTENGSQRR